MTYAPGPWYIIYMTSRGKYHAFKKKLIGGWEWTEWATFAKRYKSYRGAKAEYNRMLRTMRIPDGAMLGVYASSEIAGMLL